MWSISAINAMTVFRKFITKWCFIPSAARDNSMRMWSSRIMGPRFKSYGLLIMFSLLVLMSILSVFTNVLFSVVLTSGSYSNRSPFGKLAEQGGVRVFSKRSVLDGDIDLEFADMAIGGIQGIVPGNTIVDHSDSEQNQTDSPAAYNLTSASLNETNLVASNFSVNSNDSELFDDTFPTERVPIVDLADSEPTGPAPSPAANNVPNMVSTTGGKPWWWVDFKVDNATYLKEIDQYLFSVSELTQFTMNVTLEDIDNLRVELPDFIPNMRNPCWLEEVPDTFTYENSLYKCHINYRRIRKSFAFLTILINQRGIETKKWRMRCFPSFMLIGVAKCGTTDLYEALIQHPDIITSELKEPEYWSRQRYGKNPWLFQTDCPAYRLKSQATFADYLDTYDNASEAMKRSFIRESDGSWHSDTLFGDYSTHTMEELFYWDRSKDEPTLITADHIHKLRPQTKFIIILRDPVERAYSRYKMRFKNRGNVAGTSDDFHERMVKQIAGTEACLRMYKRRVCVYKENIGKAGDHTILVNGMYIIYIKDWLAVFPLDQFMIIRFEDYIMDRIGHIEKVTEFLGLNPMPDPDKDRIRSMPAANAGISIGSGMKNETMLILQNFFKPFNEELMELTSDDRFSWGY